MPSRAYETTASGVACALLAGALTGGALVGLELATVSHFIAVSPKSHHAYSLRGAVTTFVPVALVALIFFAGGLAIIGAPLWLAMHRLGWRSWLDAAVAGFVATGIGMFLLSAWPFISHGHKSLHDWWKIVEHTFYIAPVGAIVGLVIWRIAYRPVRTLAKE